MLTLCARSLNRSHHCAICSKRRSHPEKIKCSFHCEYNSRHWTLSIWPDALNRVWIRPVMVLVGIRLPDHRHNPMISKARFLASMWGAQTEPLCRSMTHVPSNMWRRALIPNHHRHSPDTAAAGKLRYVKQTCVCDFTWSVYPLYSHVWITNPRALPNACLLKVIPLTFP